MGTTTSSSPTQDSSIYPTSRVLSSPSASDLGFMIGYGCRKVCNHANHPFSCGKDCVEYMNNLVGNQSESFEYPQHGLKRDIIRDNKELVFLLVIVICALIGYILYQKK